MEGDTGRPLAHITSANWPTTDDEIFTFHHDLNSRRPRAWERAPRDPHLARHKGRKVWKRAENIVARTNPEKEKGSLVGANSDGDVVERNPLGEVSSNTPRAVKKLRLKDVENGSKASPSLKAKYLATLCDRESGTPKRKQTRAVVLDADAVSGDHVVPTAMPIESRLNNVSIDVEDTPAPEEPAQPDVESITSETEPMEANETASGATEEDDAAEEESSETVQHEMQDLKGLVTHEETLPEERIDSTTPNKERQTTGSLSFEDTENELPKENSPDRRNTEVPLKAEGPGDEQASDANDPPTQASEDDHISQQCAQATSTLTTEIPDNLQTPRAKLLARKIRTPKSAIEKKHEFETPQIGATLLRRESLRSRTTPRRRAVADKSGSPRKRATLKKRDTLQEREILQQFNEKSEEENTKTESGSTAKSDVSDDKALEVKAPEPVRQPPSPETLDEALVDDQGQTVDTEEQDAVIAEESVPETSQEDSGKTDVTESQEDVELDQEAADMMQTSEPDKGNAVVAEDAPTSETYAVASAVTNENAPEEPAAPTRKTRSAARFSDDTSMLKDFVNRAQAKKAAKDTPILSADEARGQLQSSPRRSPRKAQTQDEDTDATPKKRKPTNLRPGTPPRKGVRGEEEADDDDDTVVTEPVPSRRSTRSRLPAPSKAPPGAPSFIPLRRGEGPDLTVIPKTQAQDLAIVTRTNTRRNKGQAKPPLLALQSMPRPESPEKGTSSQVRSKKDRARKVVSWAEELTSYLGSKEGLSDIDEQKPRVRRVRGLGSVNGTPAKKTASAGTISAVGSSAPSNGTPAPKRRGRVR